MTADLLETLNRRHAVAAVRAAANRLGIDPEPLLDSQRFYDRVTALDPDDPRYSRAITEAVQTAAGVTSNAVPTRRATQQTADEEGQWTLEDVERAAPSEVAAAVERGLLVDLGFRPRRKRR